jgi:hypothetical protein
VPALVWDVHQPLLAIVEYRLTSTTAQCLQVCRTLHVTGASVLAGLAFAILLPRYLASSFTACNAMGAESLTSLMTNCNPRNKV